MWRLLIAGLLVFAATETMSQAAMIIDDFTAGPSLVTRPPYVPQASGIGIVQQGLAPDHVWAGYRSIMAGSYGTPEPGFEPVAILVTSSTSVGRMLYYSRTWQKNWN